MLRFVLFFLAFPAVALGEESISRQAAQKLAQASFREYIELLALPSDFRKNTDFLERAFAKRGFTVKQLENKGLRAPTVSVPLVNADNNQHTFDENMRVGHYVEGIRTIAGLLRSPYR